VATAIGVMRPLAGLGSMSINNARCDFGRHLRPDGTIVFLFSWGKGKKKSRNLQEISGKSFIL